MLMTLLLKFGEIRLSPFGKTSRVYDGLIEYQEKSSNVPTKGRDKIRKRS